MPKMIVKPRLTDVFDLSLSQAEVDFVIPHLEEDLPLYVDPFLFWISRDERYAVAEQAIPTLLKDALKVNPKVVDLSKLVYKVGKATLAIMESAQESGSYLRDRARGFEVPDRTVREADLEAARQARER